MNDKSVIKVDGKRYEVLRMGLVMKGDYYLRNDGTVAQEVKYNSGVCASPALILKPLQWKPEGGDKYFVPYFGSVDRKIHSLYWKNDGIDNSYLSQGFVCKTEEEAAQLHRFISESVEDYRKFKREVYYKGLYNE